MVSARRALALFPEQGFLLPLVPQQRILMAVHIRICGVCSPRLTAPDLTGSHSVGRWLQGACWGTQGCSQPGEDHTTAGTAESKACCRLAGRQPPSHGVVSVAQLQAFSETPVSNTSSL